MVQEEFIRQQAAAIAASEREEAQAAAAAASAAAAAAAAYSAPAYTAPPAYHTTNMAEPDDDEYDEMLAMLLPGLQPTTEAMPPRRADASTPPALPAGPPAVSPGVHTYGNTQVHAEATMTALGLPTHLETMFEEVLLNFPDGFDQCAFPQHFANVHFQNLQLRDGFYDLSGKWCTAPGSGPGLPATLKDMLLMSKSLFYFVGDFPSGHSSSFVVPKGHSAALNGARRQPCPPNLVPLSHRTAPVVARAPPQAAPQSQPQPQPVKGAGHIPAPRHSYPAVPQLVENKLRKVVERFPDGVDAGSFAKYFYLVNKEFVQVKGAYYDAQGEWKEDKRLVHNPYPKLRDLLESSKAVSAIFYPNPTGLKVYPLTHPMVHEYLRKGGRHAATPKSVPPRCGPPLSSLSLLPFSISGSQLTRGAMGVRVQCWIPHAAALRGAPPHAGAVATARGLHEGLRLPRGVPEHARSAAGLSDARLRQDERAFPRLSDGSVRARRRQRHGLLDRHGGARADRCRRAALATVGTRQGVCAAAQQQQQQLAGAFVAAPQPPSIHTAGGGERQLQGTPDHAQSD
jgi:hypothetical protein